MQSRTLADSINIRRSATRLIQWDASLPTGLAETMFSAPKSLLDEGELLRSRGARRTVLVRWRGERFVLKHYVEPSWRHVLKQSVHRSRARASYFTSHELANSGISTPRPVAFVENRWDPLRRDSFLMYPYVEGRTLRDCLAGDEAMARESQRLWRQLANLWKQLQQLRVSLADANLGNFVVSPGLRLWVIDIDKARFHRMGFVARWHQERSWRQVLRSAARCGFVA